MGTSRALGEPFLIASNSVTSFIHAFDSSCQSEPTDTEPDGLVHRPEDFLGPTRAPQSHTLGLFFSSNVAGPLLIGYDALSCGK